MVILVVVVALVVVTVVIVVTVVLVFVLIVVTILVVFFLLGVVVLVVVLLVSVVFAKAFSIKQLSTLSTEVLYARSVEVTASSVCTDTGHPP